MLIIDPRLAACGLRDFDSLFHHPQAQKVRSHPLRDVTLLNLGGWRVYVKRQHRIPGKDYLASWWAGFGFVDRSQREWRALLALRRHGIPCPEPLAVGAAKGRAFVAVRELEDAVDLPAFLAQHGQDTAACLHLAESLGQVLARLHATGLTHPDIFAKHVFVHLRTLAVSLIDWQRTSRRRRLLPSQRWRDLAALDASLGEQVVSMGMRTRLLAAYLRTAGATHAWKDAVAGIRRYSVYLQGKRKVQAMRHPWRLLPGQQQIEYLRIRWQDDTLRTRHEQPCSGR